MIAIDKILKSKFGYDSFRPQQKEIINSVLKGNDTLCIMPTGGGKSICYQIPAIAKEQLALVISPLIALMKDQVDALRLNGISARYLNSSLSMEEQNRVMDGVRAGQINLLYTSPERLFSGGGFLIEFLKSFDLSLIAIDEAHCISQWGHDFRPEYRALSRLKNVFPKVPVIALTATADKKTQLDIVKILDFKNENIFISSFDRSNIKYIVKPKQKSRRDLIDLLRNYESECGIIYTLSRKSTEQIANLLVLNGFSAKAYHAGLDRETRMQCQEDFIYDRINIVVATIAFGMGIDKSNVRFVIHMDLPKNVEGYYQETGRAGRDGLASDAVLYFSAGDAIILRQFIDDGTNQNNKDVLLGKLNKMIEYGQTKKCRRKFLLNYFGEDHDGNCGNCDNCLTTHESFDGTIIAQKAFSAIYRLNQRYGSSYVIDFLRGSKSKKIKEEHTWLKTFGVGKDISKDNWVKYFRNLLDDGYLISSGDRYPILKLSRKAIKVLFGDGKVELIKTKSLKERKDQKELPHETALLIVLKEKRSQIARKLNIPPYQIFTDKTLMELAQLLPQIEEDMLHINGIGQVKLETYGKEFMDIINVYCEENALASRMSLKTKTRSSNKRSGNSKKKTGSSETQLVSFNEYKNGRSIDEIAKLRKLNSRTIESHLLHFIRKKKLDINEFVDFNKRVKIKELLQKSPQQRLNYYKNLLGKDFSYFEISATMAWEGM